jgi:alpha-galactosidase
MGWTEVCELEVDPQRARVHAEGWQSWTPTTEYRLDERQILPGVPDTWVQNYGGSRPRPPDGVFQGDGLLVLDPGTGSDVLAIGASGPDVPIPCVRLERVDSARVRVTADAPVATVTVGAAGDIAGATAAFADAFATAAGVGSVRAAPAMWCTWYQYFTELRATDVLENVDAIVVRELPVEVVLIDDGSARAPGDWLVAEPRFGQLAPVVDRIRSAGLRAGLWTAPFLAGADSVLVAEHPDWLVRGPDGGPVVAVHNWGQDTYALDLTHPGLCAHLRDVFTTFLELGIDLFKVDFLFAGALDGARHDPALTATEAYRRGLGDLRAVVGDAYLLGCGAPLLPSVGLVDAMRIGPDTALEWAAVYGDLSLAGGESAELTTRGRAYQHGRYWVNDPDCLLVRPMVEQRRRRVRLIRELGGLRSSSDGIDELDDWGLDVTAELLASVPPPVPF